MVRVSFRVGDGQFPSGATVLETILKYLNLFKHCNSIILFVKNILDALNIN